jgi:hypothetical protein
MSILAQTFTAAPIPTGNLYIDALVGYLMAATLLVTAVGCAISHLITAFRNLKRQLEDFRAALRDTALGAEKALDQVARVNPALAEKAKSELTSLSSKHQVVVPIVEEVHEILGKPHTKIMRAPTIEELMEGGNG